MYPARPLCYNDLKGKDTVIEAAELTKLYSGKAAPAVNALSLTVPAGECFGFLGPNGAGKTTTIKMLTGLLKPTQGTARIAGFDLQRQAAQAKRLTGYVPDNPFLYDKLTGREFLAFVSDLYSLPPGAERDVRINSLLGQMDLTANADQLLGGYSRGMRQKMALCAALLPRPRALFLDEPTVGLDPISTRRLKDLLRVLCREEGVAVFLSTHTLDVAQEICDRVGVFHRGRLIALGAPSTLAAQSASGRLEDVFLDMTAPDKGDTL